MKLTHMAIPDSEIEDDRPEEEPCSGDMYECRCSDHRAFWREVLADQRYQDFKDELPYAN